MSASLTPQPSSDLNNRAVALCETISQQCEALQISRTTADCGSTLFDFGIQVPGSNAAGLLLARVCLADLATVELRESDATLGPWPLVEVTTNSPIAACMASQYAGWEVQGEDYFAMGSGPMRAAAAREPLFKNIGYREETTACVGILESSKLPTEKVCQQLAQKCGITPDNLILLIAPTSSPAGTLQVVARSVETVLHKLHELGFDLLRVTAGQGTAPFAPVAKNDLAAIGVTNDAILYGGRVTLAVHGDDHSLQTLGPRLPSSSSADYGRPFAEVMAKYNNDFYQIDPLLFGAAQVTLENLDTGNSFTFGEVDRDILQQSFGEQ